MKYPVEFLPDKHGKFRWHLIAPNQSGAARIIAESGQGYASKSGARRAWRRAEAIITAGQAVEQ